jgi:hypothetical protein
MSPNKVEFPPDPESRNFNENDVLGELDRDKNGNLILLNGKDKKGRLVNKKGFLVTKNGDIIDGV